MSYRPEGRQLWKYWEPLIHREGSRIERWTLPFEPTNDPDAFERGEWFRYDQLSQMDAAVAAKDAEIARLKGMLRPGSPTERAPTTWAYEQACSALEKHRALAEAKDAEIARLKEELAKPPHHGCVEKMKEFQRERDEARERIRELEEEIDHETKGLWTKQKEAAAKWLAHESFALDEENPSRTPVCIKARAAALEEAANAVLNLPPLGGEQTIDIERRQRWRLAAEIRALKEE